MIPPLHVDRRAAAPAAADTTLVPSRHGARTASLPVVMLHGWGMNLGAFDLLRGQLAAERETWAIDLPGHGHSPWWSDAARFEPQQAAVLAALPPRCVLLGWSFGAKLAMALAAAEPARIAALVLVSATPKFAQSPDWTHAMAPEQMRAFRTVLEQDWESTLQDFVWLQLRGSRNAEAARATLEAALAAQGGPDAVALRSGLDLLDTLDLRPLAPHIRQPALIVSGQHDRVTSPAAARWLADALPDARLFEVPRAGHAPFVSHHEEVGEAVRTFLATLPPEARA